MRVRVLALFLAGLSGAAALHAQTLAFCPVNTNSRSQTCAQSSSFSFDYSQLFDLNEIVSLANSDGISFTYSFSITGGALPPGLTLSPSGLLSGTFTQAGQFTFTLTLTETVTADGMSFPFSFSFPGLGLVVTPYSGAALSVDPLALNFNLTQDGSAATQAVTLSNHSNQAVQFSVSETTYSGGNWLKLSSTAGSVPSFGSMGLAVTADPTGLQPGTYSGAIAVSSSTQSFTVSVVLVVSGTQPNLALSQTGLFFDAVSGGTAMSPQTIDVLDQGAGTLSFAASASTLSGGNWLSVSPSSGSSTASTPGSVTVSVNPTGLQQGTYYGKVSLSAPGAANSPQFTSIVLNVVSPANSPGGSVSPTGLIFVGSAGGMNPNAQTVTVTNLSPDALTYLATPFSNGNISWLTATPTSGTVSATQPGPVTVQPNLQGLAPGVYLGDLTINLVPPNTSASSSGTPPQTLHIEVLLIVLPAGVSPAIRTGLQPHAATCKPTQLLPVFTLLGTGFSVTAGWPTALEVTVVDDCGNPLVSGSVTVTFSTGDPALALAPLGGGRWSATWNASNASPGVTITAQAQQIQPALAGQASIGGTLQSNAGAPAVSTGGVVSAVSFVSNQPLAPGSYAAIFGTNLSQALHGANKLPLSTQLENTTVVLAGEPLPLLFASGGQINAILPYDVAVNSTQQLVVQNGSAISIPQAVVIAAAQPAIVTQNQTGTGAALYAVFEANGTQLANNSPVTAGDELVLYGSGLGAVNPPVPAGSETPLSTLSKTVNPVTVMFGQTAVQADFAGLAPGFAQLYQVNVKVPSGLASGNATVTLSISGQQSSPVSIAVK